MPNFLTNHLTAPSYGEGSAQSARLNRRGEQIVMPWMTQLALEGRMFSANAGTITTPVTGNLIVVDARPDEAIRVPSGTLIIPCYIGITLEATGAVNPHELLVRATTNDVGNGTSTAITAGPLNMHTTSGRASNCVGRITYTADMTAATGSRELFRKQVNQDLDATSIEPLFEISALTHPMPVLNGPASLLLYVSAPTTGATFFAYVMWAEFTSSEMA